MSSEFSVPSHTLFFAGYLDAVGRHYTDDKRLCALTVTDRPSKILDGYAIKTKTPVENMVREFDRDISRYSEYGPKRSAPLLSHRVLLLVQTLLAYVRV
jgi:hypothetical protein